MAMANSSSNVAVAARRDRAIAVSNGKRVMRGSTETVGPSAPAIAMVAASRRFSAKLRPPRGLEKTKIKSAPENIRGARDHGNPRIPNSVVVEHHHGTTVLGPRLLGRARNGRTFLAVADDLHPVRIDAEGNQIVTRRIGAPLAKRQVVLAGAAFVGKIGRAHV